MSGRFIRSSLLLGIFLIIGCANVFYVLYLGEHKVILLVDPQEKENNNSLLKDIENLHWTISQESFTLKRSRFALRLLKFLMKNASPGETWIWTPTNEYPSTPYQPTVIENEPPPPEKDTSFQLPPQCIKDEISRVCKILTNADSSIGEEWCKLFSKCYPNTLETTTTMLNDGTTYIITGDIDLMWLRDSSAQVTQYLPLAKEKDIQRIIEGLIKRQSIFITKDPYGSSFRTKLRPNPPSDDDLKAGHTQKGRNIYKWWKTSGRTTIFTKEWLQVVKIIVNLFTIEQYHSELSPYRYTELSNDHKGTQVAYTGMIWSGFRPSDEQTAYGYLIPSNMFAAVSLENLEEILTTIFYSKEEDLIKQIKQLIKDIHKGIYEFGTVYNKKYGKIYAYEVNGYGNHTLMDDANIPSLLSIPYLQYHSPYDAKGEIVQNTRNFILSYDNVYYYEGLFGKGIGSSHTDIGMIWHLAVIMEGLTTNDSDSVHNVFSILEKSHANSYQMHESFHVNNTFTFTRSCKIRLVQKLCTFEFISAPISES
ncbi:unnamed protein product [Didymodactylos carnosus]|uniref:Uncharacterized protein n=2 Tax=Didymodactylos carnosus TaxID=1234261 RepID=A0A813RH98_9BILA|nr:unnamed protein product [Didymodactylos carnosus]CAF3565641.1 unnamed protein product [Didymodactylos carnosus]